MKIPCFVLSLSLFFLVGCGSVSEIQTNQEEAEKSPLVRYSRIVVLDFKDATSPGKKDEEKRRMHRDAVATANGVIADKIASELRVLNLFEDISRSKLEGDYLEISGDITRYVEGNAAARFLVGMGAGSSYFDANVYFKDGASGEMLGSVKIDKNSWGLGGGFAAGQTVEHFMNQGAKKIAAQVKESVDRADTVAALGE
ncbi:DUF4410 domain-containing protein [Pelagicoccus mobilis]|uniref:DUF4410 domain-containing protein n=1 Tax=Pelagicoccus mobilis TaxID=415221 RepID=A0A934VKL5_9BACT|nr:DUF4410 domain-containing protein [Pelagicoccus mobilis]MBK1876816.1 DUF4410 domain-containing protein [Pelagicoccus mobilis]